MGNYFNQINDIVWLFAICYTLALNFLTKINSTEILIHSLSGHVWQHYCSQAVMLMGCWISFHKYKPKTGQLSVFCFVFPPLHPCAHPEYLCGHNKIPMFVCLFFVCLFFFFFFFFFFCFALGNIFLFWLVLFDLFYCFCVFLFLAILG